MQVAISRCTRWSKRANEFVGVGWVEPLRDPTAVAHSSRCWVSRKSARPNLQISQTPMPICEADPWRLQYFERVACPAAVNIPTEDGDAWVWYPDHRWVYDKITVATSQ